MEKINEKEIIFATSLVLAVVVFGPFTYQRHQNKKKLNKNVRNMKI